MNYIRYTFWGVVTLVLVVVGLANRTPTRLNAMPDELAEFLGLSPTIELPLFVVLFLGVGLAWSSAFSGNGCANIACARTRGRNRASWTGCAARWTG